MTSQHTIRRATGNWAATLPGGCFGARRDFTRSGEDADADLANPWLAWPGGAARPRSWQRGRRFAVRRALIIVLSRHEPGGTVRYSEVIQLQQAYDVTQLMPLIAAIPPVRGQPRQRPGASHADRGYDHDKYRRQVRKKGITP